MEKYENETIAAIATALSDSGIGIVRISGENAIYIIDNIFRSAAGRRILTKVQSHTIHYGYIVDSDENVIDEVMVAVMKAPRSYTTEDTVEINCHGGVLVMQKVLEAVLHAGARLAQPGEFTKRAFLNGRIDLSRAEAVIDVIHSQNEYALSSSVSQLKGQLSNKIHTLREDILYQIAFIESALDDPEHISLDGYPEQLATKVTYFQQEIAKLLATADNGRLIKEGISTVIVGKPNAGKSSLLNMLLGEDRAIVTEIAGTTRDALHETINLHGISLNMIDTAGIHETQDVVEKIGVERAKKYAMDADLILYVVDASGNIDEDDQNIISLLDGKKAIILLNKSDLENKITEESLKENLAKRLKHSEDIRILRTSTIDPSSENSGMEELEETIRNMFFEGELKHNNELVVTNLRHKEALQDALHSLQLVERSIEDGMPEDFYSIDLTSAYASLGKIIGEEVDEDVVNEIFSKFCMGK
ncbi:tRNA uridine-5-carboxymethylaminomethyl(34) synthesis GTPase MnmE [Waltera intestinalis]|uniref:tRNA modification GTPase MnmE n=1 Tax=Waltera intestinalis TaxID=2606635 RepID=A0A6L5YI11_9FIRM|nr:tRNA uridine-5-carboxymethylaminomethyl(34) synthesis GTPase MnmE [Waltera intestinalis]MST58014.1 tRNA uridine-5-carboxymethylaminomethyl(34) synthesis GTPase MnmE [Waltera intestinalis]